MKKYLILLLLILLAILGIYLYTDRHPLVTEEQETATTRTKLDAVREIGQWSFLTIRDEQMVETLAVVKRIWPIPDSQKRLSRIYKGTLQIGFDLKKDARGEWITARGDTVDVTLPKVHLLDDNFLDAAAARPLIEEGEWTAADRAALDQQAKRKMKAANLTDKNLKRAQASARQQMEKLLKALGYKVVNIK